jgi:5'-nucleotidase
MTIILTNDDGVAAPGIAALRAALLDAGLDVVVVAPNSNQSGVSRAATYKNPVRAARTQPDGPAVYAVAGTPVDCVRIALGGGLVPNPELVISGINHGGNVGDDILNSGTVGAAIEAALFNVPAMAVSQQSLPGHFNILDPVGVAAVGYEHSAAYGAAIARALLQHRTPQRTVVNVNVPAQVPAGLAVTRLGKRYWADRPLRPLAEHGPSTYYLIFGSSEEQPGPYENTAGTDFAALEQGLVSVTPLNYDHAEPARDDAEWAHKLVAAAESYIPR